MSDNIKEIIASIETKKSFVFVEPVTNDKKFTKNKKEIRVLNDISDITLKTTNYDDYLQDSPHAILPFLTTLITNPTNDVQKDLVLRVNKYHDDIMCLENINVVKMAAICDALMHELVLLELGIMQNFVENIKKPVRKNWLYILNAYDLHKKILNYVVPVTCNYTVLITMLQFHKYFLSVTNTLQAFRHLGLYSLYIETTTCGAKYKLVKSMTELIYISYAEITSEYNRIYNINTDVQEIIKTANPEQINETIQEIIDADKVD